MAEFNENLVKNLPDAYRKTPNSNNYKILEIERRTVNEIREDLRQVANILDINNATGKTLDLYGERVGQARGIATDDKYILMIKAKIMRNLSNGSHASIINAICATMACEPSQVIVTDGEEPYSVVITALPLEAINKAGLTTPQTLAIIKSLLPVGVKLTSFLFDGTFEFAASENEYDTEAGFCDIEGGTIGGYLGLTEADISDDILPI